MTRSLAGLTPNAASVRRPRSLWVTMRSKRPKSRFQVLVWRAVRRGSRSWAVKTSGRARVQQQRVGLGRGNPLQMEHVAVGEAKPGERERMLERLHGEPGPRRADPGREAVEAVVDHEAIGLRHGSEAEAGREQAHVSPGAGERSSERVVVRRRIGGRIGEHDVHRASLETPSSGLRRRPRPATQWCASCMTEAPVGGRSDDVRGGARPVSGARADRVPQRGHLRADLPADLRGGERRARARLPRGAQRRPELRARDGAARAGARAHRRARRRGATPGRR